MAEMPSFPPRAKLEHPAGSGSAVCEPKCDWTCGPRKECDQTCEPLCAPPECTTLCKMSDHRCETRCAKPQCAVVCPASSMCAHGDCARCRTICAPPQCTSQCSDDCSSHCAQPKCTWKCKAGECPKPKCEMKCSGLKRCAVQMSPPSAKVPQQPDMQVKSVGEATLDSKSLEPPVKPPGPWEMTTTTLPLHKVEKATADQPWGPVAQLKHQWVEEDERQEVQRQEEEFKKKSAMHSSGRD